MPGPLLPHPSPRLRSDLLGLRSAEDVRLDLSLILALRIADPACFLADVVRDATQFGQVELIALLQDTLRASLAPALCRRTPAELDADLNLRGWLATAIEHGLRVETDLTSRSGLEVLGVDAYDLRCQPSGPDTSGVGDLLSEGLAG